MTARSLFGPALGLFLAVGALWPARAEAITYPLTFTASYLFYDPYLPPPPSPNSRIVLSSRRVKVTLEANGQWSNDDGNGGEWELNGSTITLYFIDKASATTPPPYTPFGAATWRGTVMGNKICSGTIAGSNGERGQWETRGCP